MITTPRLRLIRYDWLHLEALARDRVEFARLLELSGVADGWPQFPEAFTLPPPALRSPTATHSEWPGLFFIHAERRVLLGSGGFKAPPDERGSIEFGYEIAPAFWNQGYATEAAKGLVDFAVRHPSVRTVLAHTLAEPNASNRVLQKVGLTFDGAVPDDELGTIWRWKLDCAR